MVLSAVEMLEGIYQFYEFAKYDCPLWKLCMKSYVSNFEIETIIFLSNVIQTVREKIRIWKIFFPYDIN